MDTFEVDTNNLVDIKTIEINTTLTQEERIKDFILKMKNPYVFKCGDIVVESVFADNSITLTDRMEEYFKISN